MAAFVTNPMGRIRGLTPRQLIARYPGYEGRDVETPLRRAIYALDKKIVVLDDDPTGVQTVHDIAVLTDWEKDSLLAEFQNDGHMFFILTNSRSVSQDQTVEMHRRIAEDIAAVAREAGREYLIVSRSDSTLRGHYPIETETLRRAVEECSGHIVDAEVICPFFPEGGRYTADNTHFMVENGILLPVGESEFAEDRVFGYKNSHLGKWVEEKTVGRYTAEGMTYITLDELRGLDYEGITRKLVDTTGFNKVIVNAVEYGDIMVFVSALYAAVAEGKVFILRAAAGILKVMSGKGDKPLLTRQELIDTTNKNGGIIMVGSHVNKTTLQLEKLRECGFVNFVELNQHLVVDDDKFAAELARVSALVEGYITRGKTVAVYTRRDRFDLSTGDKVDELSLAARISAGVTGVVSSLKVRPSFIIAKGGITSSDIGAKGLHVRRAMVLGQILQGVPVWLTGPESRFPNMPYVIFPGNVGDEYALKLAVEKMQVNAD